MGYIKYKALFKMILEGVIILSFVLITPLSYGQFSRSMRQIPIGNSDYNGFARMDKVFYNMPLGDGREADFFFKFTSDPRMEPKYMGMYWSIPFFDTKVYKTAEGRYKWKSPNHGTYTFNRVQKAEKGFLESYILNTTGTWKLNVGKTDIEIRRVNSSDEYYIFKKGNLVLFRSGEGADMFEIRYDKSDKPGLIYNKTKRSEEMRFVYNEEGLLKNIILKNKDRIYIEYGACDTYGNDGVSKLGKSYKSVSSIRYPDNREDRYEYTAESEKKERKYLTRDDEEYSARVSVNRITQKSSGGNEGYIEWDASTGLIMSDSGGEYAIRNPLFDNMHPEKDEYLFAGDRKRGRATQESRISYKKPEYKYAEIWDYSVRNAIKITQDPNTGEQTRTSYIGTPGNASMRIRKIEKKISKADEWEMQITKAYDDNGNLIREIDKDGNLKEFIYDKNGIHWKSLKNRSLIYMAYNTDKRDSLYSIRKNCDGQETKIIRNGKEQIELRKSVYGEIKSRIIYDKTTGHIDINGLKFPIEIN